MQVVPVQWFRGLVAIGAGGMLAAAALAQPPANGYLEQMQRVNAVLAQKTEAGVRSALLEAQNLAAKDPAKAADRLQKTIRQLEADASLTAERRDRLIGMVRRRIDALQSSDPAAALGEKELQAKIRRIEDNKAQVRHSEDDEKVRQGVNEVAALQKDGKAAEAKRRAGELAKQYPSHPVAQTTLLTASAFEQLASARPFREEQQRRTKGALDDAEKSSLPPLGDIEFPKDWKERSDRRLKKFGLQLTPKEQAILRALDTPITVNFKNESFQSVMEYLSTVLGQPILVTKSDLADAAITYETQVSPLAVKGVTARTVLRKILAEFGLTYVVKDETIQVVSQLKAREMMVVRSYYIGDLLGSRGSPGDPLTNIYGPGIGAVATMQNIAGIIEAIQTSIDPSSWQGNNGSGAIFFHYPSMSLVVKQSAEVQGVIASRFGR
jgi:hypothetical protein